MFITFEGIDGSGKTTLINKLINKIKSMLPNLDYVLTREPGGKDVVEAEKIRELILDVKSQLSSEAEALLYTTSRRIHLERVIWPALKANKLVLCDRYIDSFYAYQGFARNLGLEFVEKLTNLIINNTIPDITIFLDVTPEISKKRIETTRLFTDRLENEDNAFKETVYNGYQELIKREPNRFISVNANQSVNNVYDELIKKLFDHPKFKKWLKDQNGK